MKRIYLFYTLLLLCNIAANSQKLVFDAKYVKVGVMSNEWPSCMANNPNLRDLGRLQGESFDQDRIGKQVLDLLFQRDTNGLHMDRLYDEALQNTTVEELEVALKDVSAEAKDVLKREIAHQLLKNNYIITFRTEQKEESKKIKKYWVVYHVEIDDRIIEQAYLNWRNPNLYDQIHVSVKKVAQGKVPKSTDDNELVYDIAKKVPAFAVRGPVTSRFPFTARMGGDMGVKKTSRIYVYRFTEGNNGDYYSKKVCTTRATEISKDATRMYMISGSFPSTKKGDVAVLKDRHRSSVSVMGQGSFGEDARIGGRLQYEYLLGFSSKGIAQYLITAVGYNRHTKEPAGVWWDETKTIQPTLNNANISVGYGAGFNFLGRLEIMPYILAGYQCSFLTGGNDPMYYWDNEYQYPGDDQIGCWRDLYSRGLNGSHTEEDKGLYYHSFIAHGGVRLCVNLWYPLQLMVGADYNVATGKSSMAPLIDRHKVNRINLYAGLRLHF